ncbi:MAG: GAF and ANTAR domain-containing protein [Desulfobacteraceae bacterium]|jgi:GAF domain-containing protein
MGSVDSDTHEKHIQAITDISRVITTEHPIDEVLQRIVLTTARALAYEVCSIWLVDDSVSPRRIRLKATQAVDPEYARPRSIGRVEGVAGFVATHNQTLRIRDVLKEPRFKEKELARKLGLVSLLSVPLQVRDEEIIGVLNSFTNEPHDFLPSEVNLVTAIANLTALAILNADLREGMQAAREELETRKVVERAKEVLARRRDLSGDQAFRWIQKRSMDSRKSMRQIAEAVILSEDV